MNDRFRFRFRVWDKQNKRHIYDIERTYDSNNESGAWSLSEVLEDDNFIVEQCTGLRDKNGRLIYEGDILQYTDTHGFKIRQEVVWENDNARFTHVVEDGLGLGYQLSPLEKEICALKEIVGNIHEVEQ